MSNIIKSDHSILILNDFLENITKQGIGVNSISALLDDIIPRDKNNKLLIRHCVKEKGLSTAIFSPKYENIVISVEKLLQWLEINSIQIGEMYKIKDMEKFRKYLLLFVITHELEHGYEYLMGKGKCSAPCSLVSESYKGLFSVIITPDFILPRPIALGRRVVSLIKYKQRENEFLLERNANIEAFDLLSQLALANGEEEFYHAFLNMRNTFMLQGYTESTEGSISETYRNILMYDKYRRMKKDNDLTMEEKVRFGLEIDEETRSRVLKLEIK